MTDYIEANIEETILTEGEPVLEEAGSQQASTALFNGDTGDMPRRSAHGRDRAQTRTLHRRQPV